MGSGFSKERKLLRGFIRRKDLASIQDIALETPGLDFPSCEFDPVESGKPREPILQFACKLKGTGSRFAAAESTHVDESILRKHSPHADVLRYLISEKHVPLNTVGGNVFRAIAEGEATEDEKTECVKILVQAGARIGLWGSDSTNVSGITVAVRKRLLKLAEAMLTLCPRAEVQAVRDGDGRSPLHVIVEELEDDNEAHRTLFRAALAAGVPVNAADNRGRTALCIAAQKGRKEFAAALLDPSTGRADPDFIGRGHVLTPLHYACFAPVDTGVALFDMIRSAPRPPPPKPASPGGPAAGPAAPPAAAAASAPSEAKDRAPSTAAASDARSLQGAPVIEQHVAPPVPNVVCLAAATRNLPLLKHLLEGPQRNPEWTPNCTDFKGYTPLHYACGVDKDVAIAPGAAPKLAVVQYLLHAGADPSPTRAQLSPLMVALAAAGTDAHVDVARALLAAGADVNFCNARKETALHYCAGLKMPLDADCALLLEMLESASTFCFEANAAGATPLAIAQKAGHLAHAKALAAHQRSMVRAHVFARGKFASEAEAQAALQTVPKDELTRPDARGRTPLMLAVAAGSEHAVAVILRALNEQGDRSFDINAPVGNPPVRLLELAVACPNAAVVNTLLDHRAAPTLLASDGRTLCGIAAAAGCVENIKALIARTADPSAVDAQKRNALHHAIASSAPGAMQSVEYLIGRREFKIMARAADQNGHTPFLLACSSASPKCIRPLIAAMNEKGVKVDQKARGDNALHILCKTWGSRGTEAELVEIVEAILANNRALLEEKEPAVGGTPLILAARAGLFGVAKCLLKAGALPTATLPNGRTTLHLACARPASDAAAYEVVEELLTAHLDLAAVQDMDNVTALHLAAECNNVRAIKMVLRCGELNVNQPDKKLDTPLIYAVRAGARDAMEQLLTARATINTPGHGDLTPLQIAVEKQDMQMAEALVLRGADLNALTDQKFDTARQQLAAAAATAAAADQARRQLREDVVKLHSPVHEVEAKTAAGPHLSEHSSAPHWSDASGGSGRDRTADERGVRESSAWNLISPPAAAVTGVAAEVYRVWAEGQKSLSPADLHFDREEDRLSRGGSGTVYRARVDGTEVAVKVVPLTINRKLLPALEHELRAITRLRHPRVVPCLGLLFLEDEVWIVMELMQCSLRDYLRGDPATRRKLRFAGAQWPLPLQERMRLAMEMAEGLEFMHRQKPPLTHQDFKPENVLLGEHGEVRLCDFGSVRPQTDSILRLSMVQATVEYQAPELHYENPKPEPCNDVFSFGLVLYELFTGRHPYLPPHVPRNDIYAVMEVMLERPPLDRAALQSAGVPDVVQELIVQCLKGVDERLQRPSMRDALSVLQREYDRMAAQAADEPAAGAPAAAAAL